MSAGLTCGHLWRGGVCARCRAQTQEFALTHERERGVAEGVAAERARVVAWLRERSDADDGMGDEGYLADAIERGEHEENGNG